jgi:hypothetical protein
MHIITILSAVECLVLEELHFQKTLHAMNVRVWNLNSTSNSISNDILLTASYQNFGKMPFFLILGFRNEHLIEEFHHMVIKTVPVGEINNKLLSRFICT